MRTLIAALLVAMPLHAATLEGNADVVDGDTIKFGGSVVVRVQGIDAPETLQTCERDGKSYECGKHAAKALADLIAGRPVRCELVGRPLAAMPLTTPHETPRKSRATERLKIGETNGPQEATDPRRLRPVRRRL